eukprot:GHVT01068217.1.p1 GENE.GHVT01068217.1~~GHVT01068217.1.p1  ORF type:complete len:285 (+),score=1.49 GHVT01068217.1:197-1051(+)
MDVDRESRSSSSESESQRSTSPRASPSRGMPVLVREVPVSPPVLRKKPSPDPSPERFRELQRAIPIVADVRVFEDKPTNPPVSQLDSSRGFNVRNGGFLAPRPVRKRSHDSHRDSSAILADGEEQGVHLSSARQQETRNVELDSSRSQRRWVDCEESWSSRDKPVDVSYYFDFESKQFLPKPPKRSRSVARSEESSDRVSRKDGSSRHSRDHSSHASRGLENVRMSKDHKSGDRSKSKSSRSSRSHQGSPPLLDSHDVSRGRTSHRTSGLDQVPLMLLGARFRQ